MIAKKLLLLFIVLFCLSVTAQRDSLFVLDEVVIPDSQLRNFSVAQNIQVISDSILKIDPARLSNLLQFRTPIYIKENGFGGVASASFRGTTAQQTAVLWNGININSGFNGQADFSALPSAGFDNLQIRPGGGSVIYGSSAIGGTVHLNNGVVPGSRFENEIRLGLGSFNTRSVSYLLKSGSKKFGVQASFAHNSSDNDFEYPDGSRNNLNGAFDNSAFSLSTIYRFSPVYELLFFSQETLNDRNFSLITPTDAKTKYRDRNSRNLLELRRRNRNSTTKIKAAFLHETYAYFEDITAPQSDEGTAETFIAKVDHLQSLNHQITLNLLADYTNLSGRGSDISSGNREVYSAAVLMKQQLFKNWTYEIGIRKEMTQVYESPLLFSLGSLLNIGQNYAVRLNGSKNFRAPSLNDLYWIQGGNPDLLPETSYQLELGQDLKIGNAQLSVSGYWSKISDMIQWLPGSINVWNPGNVKQVQAYGLETSFSYNWRGKFSNWEFAGNYAYTVSQNEATGKQLIYVPFHKATMAAVYSWKRFSVDYQGLFNGEVFTRSDNNSRYNLDGYSVSHFGLAVKLGKCQLRGAIKNAFEANYSTMINRPYPGRHYEISLNLTL